MWTISELLELESTLTPCTVKETCDDDEIAVIAENPSRLRNLKTQVLVPKNHYEYSMVTICQIWFDDLDIHKWVNQMTLKTSLINI